MLACMLNSVIMSGLFLKRDKIYKPENLDLLFHPCTMALSAMVLILRDLPLCPESEAKIFLATINFWRLRCVSEARIFLVTINFWRVRCVPQRKWCACVGTHQSCQHKHLAIRQILFTNQPDFFISHII